MNIATSGDLSGSKHPRIQLLPSYTEHYKDRRWAQGPGFMMIGQYWPCEILEEKLKHYSSWKTTVDSWLLTLPSMNDHAPLSRPHLVFLLNMFLFTVLYILQELGSRDVLAVTQSSSISVSGPLKKLELTKLILSFIQLFYVAPL